MLCFVFAALVVLLDQLFKHWVVLTVPLHERLELIPGVIGLTHIENTGAAFSLFDNQRWLLAGIAFVAVIVLIFILLRYNEGFWGTLGLAAVLGGAIGNLIDRVLYGHVVDMFEPLFINFAIFNIADIFITLGGITFCIFFTIMSFKSTSSKLASADTDQGQPGKDLHTPYDYDVEQDDDDLDTLSDTKVIPPRRRPSDYVAQQASPDTGPEQEDIFEAGSGQAGFADIEAEQPASYETGPGQPEDLYAGPDRFVIDEAMPEQPAYLTPAPDASGASGTPGASGTLDALGALESELGSVKDYDVDELLREYGFEDDG